MGHCGYFFPPHDFRKFLSGPGGRRERRSPLNLLKTPPSGRSLAGASCYLLLIVVNCGFCFSSRCREIPQRSGRQQSKTVASKFAKDHALELLKTRSETPSASDGPASSNRHDRKKNAVRTRLRRKRFLVVCAHDAGNLLQSARLQYPDFYKTNGTDTTQTSQYTFHLFSGIAVVVFACQQPAPRYIQ